MNACRIRVFRTGNSKIFFLNSIATLGFFSLIVLIPLPDTLYPPVSQVVRFRDGSLMRVYLTPDEKWRIWTPLEEIDPLLVKATLWYEDRYFRYHPGVNPLAVIRALWQNVKAGRVISGGSTLTMQLARLAEPKARTTRAKIGEMAQAIRMEMKLGKRGILELYLNRAPYGGNYEGVAAASLAYFGKLPTKLTPAEVAYLVSLPQSPSRRYPRPEKSQQIMAARNRVMSRMKEGQLINEKEYSSSSNDSVPAEVRAFPLKAPHAADFFRFRYKEKRDILTTLDERIQRIAEGIARGHASRLREIGAHNASLVVMDNASREVRGLVGSLNYWNTDHGGQIIGFLVPRSPGSALKPFLYAMALQEGVITTATLLEDIPVSFGSFQPENFSGTYRGLVTAEFALAHSLNHPFVSLLQQTGYDSFLNLLERAGFRVHRDIDYGLSFITGGMEVRLLDLTNAFVTLARGGQHGRPRLLPEDPLKETFLLNAGAVSLTLQALSMRNRPDAPQLHLFTRPQATVYWKTGTSWGRRDAWSIGFTPDYTVGVWAGNFTAKGADGIVGAEAAAPILFDALSALGSETPSIPPAEADLARVQVCALSGLPPSEYCREKKEVWTVRDRLPNRQCYYHRVFLVEVETEYRACPWKEYRPGEVEQRVFTLFPPSAAAIMGIKQPLLPPFPPECGFETVASRLRLVRPTHGASYLVTGGIRQTGRIPLQAWTDTADESIYWFINDRFLRQTRSGETYLMEFRESSSREMRVIAVDSAGNSARARITIQVL